MRSSFPSLTPLVVMKGSIRRLRHSSPGSKRWSATRCRPFRVKLTRPSGRRSAALNSGRVLYRVNALLRPCKLLGATLPLLARDVADQPYRALGGRKVDVECANPFVRRKFGLYLRCDRISSMYRPGLTPTPAQQVLRELLAKMTSYEFNKESATLNRKRPQSSICR